MKSLNKFKKVGAAIAVFISRYGFLPANISPIGSFGFFGQNLFLYFATVLAFDYFKGGFYQSVGFTYLGFFGYWLIGRLAKTNKKRFLLLPLASFLFFLVSNFGVWMYWYPRTITGLLTCYTLAIPFYKSTLLGDLTFGYGYMLLSYIFKTVKNRRESSALV